MAAAAPQRVASTATATLERCVQGLPEKSVSPTSNGLLFLIHIPAALLFLDLYIYILKKTF